MSKDLDALKLRLAREKAAQAWTTEANKHKTFDGDLAEAFAEILLKNEPEKPTLDFSQKETRVMVKLASLAVHVDEYMSPDGHPADVTAIKSILFDPEVLEFVESLDRLALVPKKRRLKL